jgi:hypothetical protein
MGCDSNGERKVHKQILWILVMYQQHTSLDGLIGEYIEVISLVNAMKNKHMDTCNPMEFVVTKWQKILWSLLLLSGKIFSKQLWSSMMFSP